MCPHFHRILSEQDRHFINSLDHSNCILCLVNDRGSMSQEEIGEFLGLSKMRVCQIEKQAKSSFIKKMKRCGIECEQLKTIDVIQILAD